MLSPKTRVELDDIISSSNSSSDSGKEFVPVLETCVMKKQ